MIKLIQCLDCREIFSLIRPPTSELLVDDPDEVNVEYKRHQGHHLESLRPLSCSSFSRDPFNSSLRTVYLPVSNGQENFVVVRLRNPGQEGCRYEMKKGSILQLPPVIRIREDDLLQQIVWEKYNHHPTAEETATFVCTLKECISTIDCSRLDDEVSDFRFPLVSYGPPPPAFFEEVIRCLQSGLSAAATHWFIDFIKRHKDGPGPLWFEIHRDFELVDEDAKSFRVEHLKYAG